MPGPFDFLAYPNQPASPIDTMAKLYAMMAQRQQMQIEASSAPQIAALRDQAIRSGNLKYQTDQQAYDDQQGVRTAYKANATGAGGPQPQGATLGQVFGPGGSAGLGMRPGVNLDGVMHDLYAQGNPEASTIQTQMMARQKTANDLEKETMENLAMHYGMVGQHLQDLPTAPPDQQQTIYTQRRNSLMGAGIWREGAPEDLGPLYPGNDKVNATLAQTATWLDNVKARHEALTTPLPNQAAGILAIDPKQRTPEQNAQLRGIGGAIDLTETQPKVRANVASENARPVQVAPDPNNPGRTVWMSVGEATRRGLLSPDNASTKAAVSTAESGASGQIGNTLTAFRTAQGHLGQLQGFADGLKNGNLQAVNKFLQSYGLETGKAAPVTFAAGKTAVAGELAKTLTGTGATVPEIDAVTKSINEAGSPEQLSGVIKTWSHLIGTKRDALQQQYDTGMQGRAAFSPQGAPDTAPATQSRQPSPVASQPANPSAVAPRSSITSTVKFGDYATLNGTRYGSPDGGKTWFNATTGKRYTPNGSK